MRAFFAIMISSCFFHATLALAQEKKENFPTDASANTDASTDPEKNDGEEKDGKDLCKELSDKASGVGEGLKGYEADQWLECLPLIGSPFSGDSPAGLNAHSPNNYLNGGGWKLFPEFKTMEKL